MLRDDTKLALGPGSRLLLDKFVYDPDISGGAIVLDLVRGTFRFITGIAAKPAYVIRTPTASITVRGTIFDVFVQASGLAWLLLIEGAVEVCTENGKCLVDDEPGKLIRIGTDKVDKPVKWASLPQKQDVAFESGVPLRGRRARDRSPSDLHARSDRARHVSGDGRASPTATRPTPTTTTAARRPTTDKPHKKAPSHQAQVAGGQTQAPATRRMRRTPRRSSGSASGSGSGSASSAATSTATGLATAATQSPQVRRHVPPLQAERVALEMQVQARPSPATGTPRAARAQLPARPPASPSSSCP